MKTLNQYGAGCRCLMRMRENEGEPVISDQIFIEGYRDRFPHWQNCPGQLDTGMLCDLAKELKLAVRVDVFRDYERLLQEHRAGHAILVCTERAPRQSEPNLSPMRHTMLMMAMYETAFTVWSPSSDGGSDVLEKVDKAWWNRWYATGIVLQRTTVAATRPATSLFPPGNRWKDPKPSHLHASDVITF